MEGPQRLENDAGAAEGGSLQMVETAAKPKRKPKRHCPLCGRRLYQDSCERWYCARCQAAVEGERVSFNYIPADELDTQLQTG